MAAKVEHILLEINKLDEQISVTDTENVKALIARRNELSKQLKEANEMLSNTSKVLKG